MPREKITKENVRLKESYDLKFCKKGDTLTITIPRDIVVHHGLKAGMKIPMTPTKAGRLVLFLYGYVEVGDSAEGEQSFKVTESAIEKICALLKE